ncbi:hypothetical protein KSB_52080 [Ktedonobacter robiniae]|uniref:Nudix hydrolase domain-containing protein n=2 Tax=Ktedonobacter robiniae TaxID=2778365 RepID=A0ABQ3UVN7_9CHLR|nr:hypothetical protein KSB_52080 [Ktedonobacter robiniae]
MYPRAAQRKLEEETGLHIFSMQSVYIGRLDFACCRPGGNYHDWHVYQAYANGPLLPRLDEAHSLGWYSLETVKRLAERTAAYSAGHINTHDWERAPGLEPVWCVIFESLGLLS